MKKLTSALTLSAILAAATPAFAAGPGDQPGGPAPQMEGMPNGPHKFGPHGPRRGCPPARPLKLTQELSAMATAIGIRSNQLNVWRDFTDALQDVVQPPKPPAPKDWKDTPDAFEMAKVFADHMAEKGKKAKELKKAIEALRSSLSPEQLERAKQVRLPMPPRMGRGVHRGQPPHPRGGGDHRSHGPRPAGR